MSTRERHVRLFRNGRNQALRIPREFELEGEGALIGPNDLLTAAHALASGLTVVTANVGEFSRVPGLKVENWLQN